MENQVKMASEAQISYLQRLGYTGSTANLTAEQANNLIKAWSNRGGQNQQSQNNNYNTGYNNPQYGTVANNQSATNPQPSATQQSNNVVAVQSNFVITTRTGEEVNISPDIINAYIGANLTQPEYSYFFAVCKEYGLNPFLKDIYAIKFGTQAATFVIDYKVLQQAADNHPAFDGLKVGVIYIDKNNECKEREGAFILPGETLIGAWCDVFRKDRTHANRTYALYSENVKTKADGTINSQWANKPVFMCVKVAKAQALRETFPNLFSNNTYAFEEVDTDNIINAEVTTESVNEKQKKKTATKKIEVEDTPNQADEEFPE